MKKLFSIILSIVFLLSGLVNIVFATETEIINEITNVAPQGIAYSSSEKNSLWTPAKTINDGVHGSKTWEGWECAYPTVEKGQNTSAGFNNEYCGINFDTKFFEISEIKICLGLHTLLGGQNAKYEVLALVEGKWQTVASFEDKDTIPYDEKYSNYEDVMADISADQRVLADTTLKLDTPIATNNIRLNISEFGKNYEGGDVKVFPYIYEIELYGIAAEAPDIILPEGATATTNIAWYSYPEASSSQVNHYPYLAIDEDNSTYWSPAESDESPSYTLVFDKEYSINKLILVLKNEITYVEFFMENDSSAMTKDIDLKNIISKQGENFVFNYECEKFDATKVGFRFKGTDNIELVAFEAYLSDTRTYYFDERFDANQKASASLGNLAIIGEPYASSSFTPYSNVNYIIDGLKDNKQWFTGTVDVPAYCGLTFDIPQKISKATITVKIPSVVGTEVMSFEIQALVNGKFVKLCEGKSYNSEEGYSTSYTFDEVETTDIRVIINEIGGAIPNITELELFNKDNKVLPMFDGIEKVIALDSCIVTDNPIINDHTCEKNDSNALVPVMIGIGVVAIIAITIIVLVVIKKKNKEV